ncbi:hypothetical protein GSI_07558 [Ganoderma sinense ZZ0214-1]|uniref:Uncharacterized protein n=1 Tax=Ganoderma sinense ZZ0214-1 TaxID=1077348 RepID=A0A2G8S9D5_9APHY|nr:hypothetical protein GSI_07558 [Ganoderma sinense ZZ0214-1]
MFFAMSTFVPAAAPMMNRAALDALFEYFSSPGHGRTWNGLDALYSIQYYGTIPDFVRDKEGIAFIQGMKKAVEDNQP